MIYAAYGLVFGLFIPYLARRFSKFMPATPGLCVVSNPQAGSQRFACQTRPVIRNTGD